ncbi:hypothetical protein NEUTE1DRAFT_47389 [Neurospora tetrasperma FGSC 2508]|uniref:Uncharacterized protein n=1 Tax=Neurospora tetrasperma (strain FGSC 2508 / ATCC MYA-4615 / P0657) TaxID=510951 RepID=F8MU26_NEUT8|nr:uncharacterized protein NEUTE1DRAFT_47389 [Neurospora tetrasperma FGSC 2508]EGO55508.1 hypothetical protein NEUTE1DRAFT_47389 [Neurospora tetrasperma FGSC 2508]EGZ69256.1 hypothetical protein NEUTE2DRAFT_131662 [Neurospora tetrasperma FGSC 2509]
MTKFAAMLRALKRRNLAGQNGNFNVRCHQLHGPTFPGIWVRVGFGVGAPRFTLKNILLNRFILIC